MNTSRTPNYYFALYSYEAEQPGDLDFKSGDLLDIITLPSASENWVKAKNPRTEKIGMAPSNYITAEKGYSASFDAFNCVNRDSAVTLLKSPNYRKKFNYVVRPSTDSRALALSVLMNTGQVVHYKIHFNPSQENCFIYPAQPFDTIEDLIVHYMDIALPRACILQAYTPFRELSEL